MSDEGGYSRTLAIPEKETLSTVREGHSVFCDNGWGFIASNLKLSNRHVEVIQGLFDDKTEAAIARGLGISPHTVHTHLERIYRKLNVNSRTELIIRIVAEHVSIAGCRRAESSNPCIPCAADS